MRSCFAFASALALAGSAAVAQTTERVNVSSTGAEARDALSAPMRPSASEDGRGIAFESASRRLVSDDTNDQDDVFVRDRLAGTTMRASVSSVGIEGNSFSGWMTASLSADGQIVAFESNASNLVP